MNDSLQYPICPPSCSILDAKSHTMGTIMLYEAEQLRDTIYL